MFDFVARYSAKIKRKGYLVYVGIIVLSSFYVIHSISNIPTIEPKKDKPKKKGKDVAPEPKEPKKSEEPEETKEPKSVLKPLDPSKTTLTEQEVEALVKTWTKRELYGYLIQERIYLDINAKLDFVRAQVVQVYLSKQNQ